MTLNGSEEARQYGHHILGADVAPNGAGVLGAGKQYFHGTPQILRALENGGLEVEACSRERIDKIPLDASFVDQLP